MFDACLDGNRLARSSRQVDAVNAKIAAIGGLRFLGRACARDQR